MIPRAPTLLFFVVTALCGGGAEARSGSALPLTAASAVDALATTALSSMPKVVSPAKESAEQIEAKAKARKGKGRKAKAARRALKGRKAHAKRGRARKAKRARRRARRGFVQLAARGPGFFIRDPRRSWGTELTVRRLKETAAAYAKRFPEAPPIRYCDLSRRWGGRFRPHVSHRTGRDVDIDLILKRPRKTWVKASGSMIHAERMWFFVSSLVASGDVQYIFLDRRLQRALYRHARAKGHSKEELGRVLQYPRRGAYGIVRHWRGHRDHIHVRFVRPTRKKRAIPVS